MARRVGPLFVALVLFVTVVVDGDPVRACTSIMVGKQASTDGSVMTSHTCDSHRTGSAIVVVPHRTHAAGSELRLTKRTEDDTGPMERYGREFTGTIPQVAETHGYLSPAYAAMNEHQVAIGESTFGGREELQSEAGIIDCETLTRLMLERATTAREAIRVGGELLERHGWVDSGEALTIADTGEVWLMEIVGPGKGEVGAIWAAQRVPDGEVAVIANGARIGEIDLSDPDHFMASSNVVEAAVAMGYWDPAGGSPFRFYEAYNPDGRMSFGTTRREWRVLDLLAPSLGLHGNSNVLPFSIKPERPVGPETIMELFRDTYEGTAYDVTDTLTVTDDEGKTVKSPLANPFMPYEMNKLLRINGGWGWRGERQIARWYCMYATVTQSRGWLPDPVGGIVWFGLANPAMTTYVPIYAGVEEIVAPYRTDGRTTGFSRESAYWAFNRVSTIAAHRWGDMRKDVAEVRNPLQQELLARQADVDERASRMIEQDPAEARRYLTEVSAEAARRTLETYWNLGDLLWSRYHEKW